MHPALVLACNALKLVNIWLTPFLRLTSAVPKTAKLRDFIAPFKTGDVPVVVQLMGVDAAVMSDCAAEFMALGAAGINVNCACPSNQVVRHGAGGGALRNPAGITALLETMQKALPGVSLSVKLRTGFDECDMAWYSELAALHLSGVFLHFRTVKEQYKPLDWQVALQRFAAAQAGLRQTFLVANGDIGSAAQLADLRKIHAGIGVMIGRNWFKDPYIFRRLTAKDNSVSPGAEAGRKRWFEQVIKQAKFDESLPFNNGKAIELATLMWGKPNHVLTKLTGAGKNEWRNLTE